MNALFFNKKYFGNKIRTLHSIIILNAIKPSRNPRITRGEIR